MSEKAYMDADYEVISMVNRKAGRGGQLPGKVIHFIPKENAASVLAIDKRIQQIREHMPMIVTGALVLSFLIGLAV
jgi:hypothetical protein